MSEYIYTSAEGAEKNIVACTSECVENKDETSMSGCGDINTETAGLRGTSDGTCLKGKLSDALMAMYLWK